MIFLILMKINLTRATVRCILSNILIELHGGGRQKEGKNKLT